MGLYGGINLPDLLSVAPGLHATAPSASTVKYVDIGRCKALVALITCSNSANAANNGSAIALYQATNSAGAGAKALAFTRYYGASNTTVNAASPDLLVIKTASSNTFTTINTANTVTQYLVPIDPATLDTTNAFDFVTVTVGNSVGTTLSVNWIAIPLYGAQSDNTLGNKPSILV